MISLQRRRFLQVVAGAAIPAVARTTPAQGFSSGPITVVVSTGAGGPADTIARIIAERLRATLGQTVIVENSAGIGTVGMSRVARAKPDGHILAFSASFSTHVVHAAIHKLPYDVVSDFEPVALAADGNVGEESYAAK